MRTMEKREKADGSKDNFFDWDLRFSRDIKKEKKCIPNETKNEINPKLNYIF